MIIVDHKRYNNTRRPTDSNGRYYVRPIRDNREWHHNTFEAVFNSEKERKREEYRDSLRKEVNRRLQEMRSNPQFHVFLTNNSNYSMNS